MHSIWRKPTNDMIVSRVVQDGATIYTIGFLKVFPMDQSFTLLVIVLFCSKNKAVFTKLKMITEFEVKLFYNSATKLHIQDNSP